MGDDAEYYMEQQEEERQHEQACREAAARMNIKVLITWTDGIEDELWSWSPLEEVYGIFSRLYNNLKIGNDYFLVSSLPYELDEDYEYDEDEEFNEDQESDEIDENVELAEDLIVTLKSKAVDDEIEASYEIIILSEDDKELLQKEAVRQKNEAAGLKELMISEMLMEMVEYIESGVEVEPYVFAREI